MKTKTFLSTILAAFVAVLANATTTNKVSITKGYTFDETTAIIGFTYNNLSGHDDGEIIAVVRERDSVYPGQREVVTTWTNKIVSVGMSDGAFSCQETNQVQTVTNVLEQTVMTITVKDKILRMEVDAGTYGTIDFPYVFLKGERLSVEADRFSAAKIEIMIEK